MGEKDMQRKEGKERKVKANKVVINRKRVRQE